MSQLDQTVEPPYKGFYRAGDVVRHLPTGETWCLAIDEEQGYVQPSGWPHYMARTKEVRLIKKASDEARLSTLRSWASEKTSAEANNDMRCLIARRLLQEAEEKGKLKTTRDLVEDFRWATMNDATVSKYIRAGAPLEVIIGQLAREKAKLTMDLIEAESHIPQLKLVRPSSKKEEIKS